jgi:hypothetical protein
MITVSVVSACSLIVKVTGDQGILQLRHTSRQPVFPSRNNYVYSVSMEYCAPYASDRHYRSYFVTLFTVLCMVGVGVGVCVCVWSFSRIIIALMTTVSTSATSIDFYQTTRRNVPKGNHIHTCRHENLKSRHPLTCLSFTLKVKFGALLNNLVCHIYLWLI